MKKKTLIISDPLLEEFLRESNAIEGVYDEPSLQDAFLSWTVAMKVDTLTLHDIRKIHENLMYRIWPEIAGCLRRVGVMVGGRICPNPGQLNRLMSQWWDAHAKANTDETIKQAHIAFEKVHPFRDGNGRAGRIIMNWQRVKAGLPLLIIHVGDEQQEYYSWFK